MLSCKGILLVICCYTYSTLALGDEGNFLHISDVHYDPYYGDGVYPISSSCGSPVDPTEYPLGSHDCDSPWSLVQSVITMMSKTMTNETDFAVWTGDTAGALPQSLLNDTTLLSIIHNVSQEIRDRLPGLPVFPAIGNHDNVPRHLLEPEPNEFRDSLAEAWDPWLRNYQGAMETFKLGGYYVTPVNSKLWMVVLNTAMYYFKDTLTEGITDPAGQFVWLDDTLRNAESAGKKVFISAHILPGSLERGVKVSFQPSFNEKYLEIIQKYSQVIKGQFFGHHHYDSFRILYDDTGVPTNALYVQPSVTPRQSPAPRNPSFRMVTYDRDTGDIIDIHQYYLDISDDNPTWALEYRATEAYEIADLTPQSLHELVDTFSSGSSTTDFFQRYYMFNTIMADAGECDEACKRGHICAITKLGIPDFEDCVAGSGSNVRGSLKNNVILFLLGCLIAINQ